MGFAGMSKFEKRLCILALVFVVIYIGAAAWTIQSRISGEEKLERFESPEIKPAEGRLLMAELFLPMSILLTLTVCFIIARKQRAKKRLQLDDPDESSEQPPG